MDFDIAKKLIEIAERKGFVASSYNDFGGSKSMVLNPPYGKSGSELPEQSEQVEDALRADFRRLCSANNLKLRAITENGQGYHISIQDLPKEQASSAFSP